MTHNSFEQPDTALERLSEDELETLQERADRGEDAPVLEYMRTHGLFERALATCFADVRCNRRFEDILSNIPATNRDKERLLVSWLHHKGTAWHGLTTADYARIVLANEPELAQAIYKEGASKDDVLRGALLHDEGKKSIPRRVLANPIDEEACKMKLLGLMEKGDSETLALVSRVLGPATTTANLETRMREENKRPVFLVPIQYLVESDDLKILTARGFAINEQSLMDVLAEHERYTRERLVDEPTLVDIAGYHHSIAGSTTPLAATLVGSASRVAQEFLHAVDCVEAITALRDYKPGKPLVVALVAEIHEALEKKISDFVVFRVVRALYNDSEQIKQECLLSPDSCREIERYLADHFTEQQVA